MKICKESFVINNKGFVIDAEIKELENFKIYANESLLVNIQTNMGGDYWSDDSTGVSFVLYDNLRGTSRSFDASALFEEDEFDVFNEFVKYIAQKAQEEIFNCVDPSEVESKIANSTIVCTNEDIENQFEESIADKIKRFLKDSLFLEDNPEPPKNCRITDLEVMQ